MFFNICKIIIHENNLEMTYKLVYIYALYMIYNVFIYIQMLFSLNNEFTLTVHL